MRRDVITIDKASGKITKLGRSFSRARDYDAMGPDVSLNFFFHSQNPQKAPHDDGSSNRPALFKALKVNCKRERKSSTLSHCMKSMSSTADPRASWLSFLVTRVKSSLKSVNKSTSRSPNGARKARQRLCPVFSSLMKCIC